tara:strand:- start:5247 stop:5804 length:558 start_codon:yes stop_codon:yes gene_type:complete
MNSETHLLIVDDDERFRERLALSFRRKGYEVHSAGGADEALRCCREQPIHFAVVDLRMPDGNGLDLIGKLRSIRPESKVLILTGYGSVSTAKEALRQGAVDYLMKPTDAEEIEAAIHGCTEGASKASAGAIPSTPVEVPSLDRVEWEHIQRVLSDSDGNISEAARRLGIQRRTLQRKLQKYPPHR